MSLDLVRRHSSVDSADKTFAVCLNKWLTGNLTTWKIGRTKKKKEHLKKKIFFNDYAIKHTFWTSCSFYFCFLCFCHIILGSGCTQTDCEKQTKHTCSWNNNKGAFNNYVDNWGGGGRVSKNVCFRLQLWSLILRLSSSQWPFRQKRIDALFCKSLLSICTWHSPV